MGVKEMKIKVRSGAFKHIEAELFGYDDTVREIKRRREELMSKPTEELVGGKSNLPGDPTGRLATRLAEDKRLEELERIAYAIEHIYNMVDCDYKKLIRLRYWTRPQTKTWEGIAQELLISRATAFRRRDEIVQAVGEVLGWR